MIHVHFDSIDNFLSRRVAQFSKVVKMHFTVQLNILIVILTTRLLVISCSSSANVCTDSIRNSSTAVTALILARGGSKGIKLKNIQTIHDVSLLGLSLTALQDCSSCFDTIWVSTDHELIAQEAERCEKASDKN